MLSENKFGMCWIKNSNGNLIEAALVLFNEEVGKRLVAFGVILICFILSEIVQQTIRRGSSLQSCPVTEKALIAYKSGTPSD